jgi:hypothetical protein
MKTLKEIKSELTVFDFCNKIHSKLTSIDSVLLDIPQPSVSPETYLILGKLHREINNLIILLEQSKNDIP